MADTISRLSVVLEASTSKFKNSLNEVRALTSSVAKEIKKETDNMKKNFQLGKTGNAGLETKEFKKVREQIETVNNTLDEYRNRMRDMKAYDVSQESEQWKAVQNYIANATRELHELRIEEQRLVDSGDAFQGPTSFIGGIFKNLGSGASATLRATGKALKDVGQAGLSVAWRGMKSAAKGIKEIGKEAMKNLPIVKRFGQAQKTLSNGFNLKSLLKYGLGIRSLYALVNKIRHGIVEGFKNLAQYSDETNRSISTLMSSASQLKNAFAAAFSPLLNAIAPILDAIVQKVISAVNAFGQLVGALTGNATYVRARKQNIDYAASLNQNASSANNAAKANQNLKRSIMGFDQLNKMDDNSANDNSGDMGNTGSTVNPGDMFETQSIPSKMKSIADAIKEAWKAADFTAIGSMLGEKLNSALGSIQWDKIKDRLNKIATSLATFLNGFIKSTDWSLVGATFAEKINTAIGALGAFITSFNFSRLGLSIATAFNGYISTLDVAGIAVTLSNLIIKVLNTGIAFVKNVNWYQLGNKIMTGITSIKWGRITSTLFNLIGTVLGSLPKFLGGLIGDKLKAAERYFRKNIEECGGNIPAGILKGILNGLKSIGRWIIDNIFTPFWNGLKSAFKMHSPSKVMEEAGKYIVYGIKNGILLALNALILTVKTLPAKIKTALGNLSNYVKSKGTEVINGIKTGASEKWASTKLWFQNMAVRIKAALGDTKTNIITKGSAIMSGLKAGAVEGWNTIKTWFQDMPTRIENALPSLRQIGCDWIDGLIQGILSMTIPIPKVELGKYKTTFFGKELTVPKISISWNAAGGFPEAGQLFVANEKGPEMVGKMGKKTTVANQQQIVSGIKAGVFEAVMDAFNASGIFDKGSTSAPVTEFTFKVDSETLYKSVQKGKQKHDNRFQLVTEF